MSGEWLVSREAIEEELGARLSEEEWRRIADEIGGRVENFIEEILPNVIEEVRENCVICRTLSLSEYGCSNHKAMRECVDCCGCLDEEGKR